ncbi:MULTISPECIES: MFS transporter [unclassified Paenibacillus]|uniref:MFS transporter n=1 Tax=unclassified Paenibacillus TaxID=185978 RepID=UPI0024064BF6|nr:MULTISPECIES: MFS transporter [unclassified Paenibacillus]MDF9839284.1 DHA1 family inner membrane transport protein [Paenibacillus sp. PastF-2]MDF9845865.1 DHA1 family inner membrane transport protein [Paenibacillus sp. PastM-2]MDF9852438.1 DHA1 family inner membrane transport protein [Paenibacillus sp. PastF-1]MDH6477832.1 DHA1 family inner membrane transport protein [Paenibacillus sp. PastH-2]MDH6505571.1 DHA1 family inner membrane transport protein [Paenibacillus sp. PastM-3]
MKKGYERGLVFSFTFMAFLLGTTEYIIVGLLSEIAASLQITLAVAGSLVSGFAIAYALGTPVLMTLVSRLPKKQTILGTIALIVMFNLFSAVSGTYGLMLFTRIATAVLCGLAISLSLSAVSEVVTPARQGKAVSYILGGFGIANVLGVPIGTFVGQHFEWQAAFVLTAVMGAAAFVLNLIVIPSNLTNTKASLKDQLSLLANRRMILAFLIPVFGTGAVFSIYTYIRPLMDQVMNVPATAVSWVLLVYGLATIFSTWLGGIVASGNALGRLRVVFLVQAAIYVLFFFAAPVPVLGLLFLILSACVSNILNVTAQLYLIELAVEHSPGSRDFAASLNPVAANTGIAGGSALGGLVVGTSGLAALSWTAAGIAVAAFAVTAISYRLKQKSVSRKAQAAAA